MNPPLWPIQEILITVCTSDKEDDAEDKKLTKEDGEELSKKPLL